MSQEWSAPKGYEITIQQELDELVHDVGASLVDNVQSAVEELYEIRHPGELGNTGFKASYVNERLEQGPAYGTWFHYPWKDTLVHLPPAGDFYDLRTASHRNLIKSGEQQTLRDKKLAFIGLSIGSNATVQAVKMGIGSEVTLFDYDRLSWTNLNRVPASPDEVGLLKTTITGRRVAEIDPYIRQRHYPEGYVAGKTEDIMRALRPDAIVEEVDNPAVKGAVRRLAEGLRVPVVMAGDVDDRSTIDVERYDREKTTKPFNGKLPASLVDRMAAGELSPEEHETALIKILGLLNISPRMFESATAKGRGELTRFPQKGTTAVAGAALITVALRDIFLDRKLESGTGVVDLRKAVGAGPPTTFIENVKIGLDFLRYRREQAKKKGRE